MWVASYGVMPQAYRLATGPGAARTSSPVAVSWIRGPGVLPGSTGTAAPRQESMPARLSRAAQQVGAGRGARGAGRGARGAGRGARGAGQQEDTAAAYATLAGRTGNWRARVACSKA